MEAVNLSVAIAPPVFSPGAEEARKENTLRESIPQLPQSENSAKQGPAGGDSTSGTNSSLYAQSQALVQNATEQNQGKERDKGKGKDKKEDSKLDATASTKASSSKSDSLTSSSLLSPQANLATAIPTSAKALGSVRLSNKDKLQASAISHVKYSTEASSKLSEDDQKHLSAVAKRYNDTAHIKQLGLNIDASI